MFPMIAGAVAFVGAMAPVQSHQYWVRIPQTNISCEEEANRLALKFETATQLKVTEKLCRGTIDATMGKEKVKLYSLLLTYPAEQKVSIKSTQLEATSFGRYHSPKPAYDTYSDCVADLENQVQHFERQTQLPAIAAFCDRAKSTLTGFALEIQSAGKPAAELNAFLLETPEVDARLEQDVRQFVESLGAQVVRDRGTTLFYYSAKPLSIRQPIFSNFTSPERCERQIEAIHAILRDSGSTKAYVRCLPSSNGMFTRTYTLADGWAFLSRSEAEDVYYSFDECMSDRTRVLNERKNHWNAAVGALCVENPLGDDRFKMEIYSK